MKCSKCLRQDTTVKMTSAKVLGKTPVVFRDRYCSKCKRKIDTIEVETTELWNVKPPLSP